MINNQPITAYLGLGSNLGDRRQNLEQALIFLAERIKIEKRSPIYDTAPVGNTHQPRFLNMAIQITTRLPAATLLFMAKGIEAKLGRVPIDSPRPIDIDILLYGDQVIDTPPELVVPHPRMLERAFVLLPLADIAPDLLHPAQKRAIRQLRDEVPGKQTCTQLSDEEKK